MFYEVYKYFQTVFVFLTLREMDKRTSPLMDWKTNTCARAHTSTSLVFVLNAYTWRFMNRYNYRWLYCNFYSQKTAEDSAVPFQGTGQPCRFTDGKLLE